MSEAYDKLRAALDERLKADKRLETIAQKITSGKADFKDTAKYSQIVSHIMGKVMQENIGSITVPLGKELVCKELLREHYERINDVLGEVQASVDDKLGIHLNPVRAPFPTERVDKAAHSLEDPTVPEETIKRRARSTTENIANSMHDDYIQTNASRRDAAGLKSFLVREVGAGGCCKWCASLAGRYDYATAPDDVFRRHDNCNCSVTYENGRQRQDVWSKKTWQASEDELKARKEAETASKPVVNSKEQAKELEARVLMSMNRAKATDIFDFDSLPISSHISPQAIADELEKSDIGKETLKVIETLPQKIKLMYGKEKDVRGSEWCGRIEIYVNQCKDSLWAARTVIHECTHYRYGIGQSQWSECVCIAQELKHARGRNNLTISEKRTIIEAVKKDADYKKFNWRKGGTIYGKQRSH